MEFGAFYPYNMTFGGSNFTNFPESCVGLTSLYGDKGLYSFSTGRFHFFYLRKREAQGGGFARLPQRPALFL